MAYESGARTGGGHVPGQSLVPQAPEPGAAAEEGFCGGLVRIRGIFFVVVLYGCLVGARTAVRFAFLRTMVVCDAPPAPPPAPWSGSAECGDAGVVNAQATVVNGVLTGLDNALQALCMPLLGAAADTWGRARVVRVSMWGLVVASALFYGNTFMRGSGALFGVGVALQGASSAIAAVGGTIIADSYAPGRRAGYFGFLNATGTLLSLIVFGAVSGSVVAGNTVDYSPTALWLLIVAGAAAGLSHVLVTETLPVADRRPWASPIAHPRTCMAALRQRPLVTAIAVVVAMFSFGASSLAVYQACIAALRVPPGGARGSAACGWGCRGT